MGNTRPEPYVTAIHEAGHAVAGIFYKLGKIKTVSIIPGEDDWGRVITEARTKSYNALEYGNILSAKQEQYFKQVLIATMAGPAAEAQYLKEDFLNENAKGDLDNMWDLTSALFGSPEVREAYSNHIIAEAKAFVALEYNWMRITAIADELAIKKSLTYKQSKEIYYDS